MGFAAALIILLGLAGAYALWQRPWEARGQGVATETLFPGPISLVLALNGKVVARESVTVRSSVSALATAVPVREGAEVDAGDVLALLDGAIAEAQVGQAQAALDAQQVRQRQAEATAERTRALGENSPRSALEDAERAAAAAASETAQLQAALDLARRQLAQYTVRSPISGLVLSRGVEAGQLVDPQTQMFTVADTSELFVEADVDESFSAYIREGLDALLLPVGATQPHAGSVVFASPVVDSATGGRRIRIAFAESMALPVGLTVNASVIVDETDNALSLSRRAILTEGARSFVLRVENGIAVERAVSFLDWPADRVMVTEGLAAGDVVILDPETVEPGALVIPR